MQILFIGILTCLSILALGGTALMLLGARREARIARRRAVEDYTGLEDASSKQILVDTVGRIGEAVTAGKVTKTLRSRLTAAGFHGRTAPAIYLGSKVLLLALSAFGLGLFLLPMSISLPVKMFLVVCLAGCLFFLPNVLVNVRQRRRTTEIQRKLPDAVDLLEICVSSGMGVDTAWNAVAAEVRRVSPTLADEMELTTLEIGLGVDRAVAMKHMAERTNVDDITSLVALLIQAERFGTSIADALRIFAKSIRQIQSSRAEEAAEKMAVKLLFPMVLFIFPSLLVVLVGPAVMMLVETIS